MYKWKSYAGIMEKRRKKMKNKKKSACSDAGRSSDAWVFPNYGRSCE